MHSRFRIIPVTLATANAISQYAKNEISLIHMEVESEIHAKWPEENSAQSLIEFIYPKLLFKVHCW